MGKNVSYYVKYSNDFNDPEKLVSLRYPAIMMIEPLMAIIRVEDPCEDYSVLHA
jgi:hypothetical protein